jgi:hypothetical protein
VKERQQSRRNLTKSNCESKPLFPSCGGDLTRIFILCRGLLGLPSQYGVDEVHESHRDFNSGPGAPDLASNVKCFKETCVVSITAMLKSGVSFRRNLGAGLGACLGAFVTRNPASQSILLTTPLISKIELKYALVAEATPTYSHRLPKM